MRPRDTSAWLRIQETPIELAVALVAVIIGASNLLGRNTDLTILAVMLYATMAVGGATLIAGRLVGDNLNVQSVGLAMLAGGYAFLTLRKLGHSPDVVNVAIAILNSGALLFGLLIRLRVVRKAIKANERMNKVLAAKRWSRG